MTDTTKTTEYELKVKRLGFLNWRYHLLRNGNGTSTPLHETWTRRGAIRAARRQIRHDKRWQAPWEVVEKVDTT
jgi:hypothetical protein